VSNPVLNPLAVARKPQQQRARARFEQVLDCADGLLREEGLAGRESGGPAAK